jgi:hypothetical protein
MNQANISVSCWWGAGPRQRDYRPHGRGEVVLLEVAMSGHTHKSVREGCPNDVPDCVRS